MNQAYVMNYTSDDLRKWRIHWGMKSRNPIFIEEAIDAQNEQGFDWLKRGFMNFDQMEIEPGLFQATWSCWGVPEHKEVTIKGESL